MLLQRLSEARGVSGNEDEVRAILLEEIRPHVDEWKVDSIGNLIATVRARPGHPTPHRVLVTAHMDEVGLMIVHIEKNGLLRFRPVGGIDPRVLPGKRVLVGRDGVPGVIGLKPVHLLTAEEEKQVVQVEQMYVDIGAKDRDEAASVVRVGDLVTFATGFQQRGKTLIGKAFDDRAGCAVLAELVQERYDVELVAAFTVQEEVGLRGAQVAAYAVEPEVGIALEGTICDDLPRKRDQTPVTRLGHGPAVTVMDRTVISDRRLVDLVLRVAREEKIPCQVKGPGLGGTDAGAIHLTRQGVPSVAVATPARYIHTPVSVMNLDDLEHTVALMKAVLRRLHTDFPWGA
ncbi:MAG: M42 family metallopeptidase [Chloroflexia bacterium]